MNTQTFKIKRDKMIVEVPIIVARKLFEHMGILGLYHKHLADKKIQVLNNFDLMDQTFVVAFNLVEKKVRLHDDGEKFFMIFDTSEIRLASLSNLPDSNPELEEALLDLAAEISYKGYKIDRSDPDTILIWMERFSR